MVFLPNTTWTITFFVTVLLQGAAVLACEAYVFAEFQKNLIPNKAQIPSIRPVPTYLALFIFGAIYQLLLVWDSLRAKNTIQVIGLVIYNFAMLVYGAVQIKQIEKAILFLQASQYLKPGLDVWQNMRPFLIAVPIVSGIGTIVLAFAAWKLYDEFAWTIYKHISADLRMKRRYLAFQIYIALLKFDFFFFLGFSVQFLVIVATNNITDAEFYLTIAAVPVTILILCMAAWWTRRENVPGMIVIIVLYIAGSAYFIFKLVRIYQPSHESQYRPVRTSLTIFAVLTLILIILTIVNASVCMANFGKGLKPFVLDRKLQSEEEKMDLQLHDMQDTKYGAAPGQLPSRMTID